MSTIDSAPEGGKFRAQASSGLDATAGAWGDGDLLCVAIDSSGTLELATASNVDGVILTSEGKRDNTASGYKNVVLPATGSTLRAGGRSPPPPRSGPPAWWLYVRLLR